MILVTQARCTRVQAIFLKLRFILAVPSLLRGVSIITQINAEQMILLLWLHIKWLQNQISSTNNSLILICSSGQLHAYHVEFLGTVRVGGIHQPD